MTRKVFQDEAARARMMERAQLRAQVATETRLGISHPKVMGVVSREIKARHGGARRATLEQEIRWIVEAGQRKQGRASATPLEVVRAELPKVRGEGRFGDRKVYVVSLWQRVKDRVGMSLDEFKRWLFAQHRARQLELVRADLTNVFSQPLLRASEFSPDGIATYHLVIDPTA